MAITAVDYEFWKHLRDRGLLPEHPDVIEFGQANWYGDVNPNKLITDVRGYCDPADADKLLGDAREGFENRDLFLLARVFYRTLLRYSTIYAIDLHGPAEAIRLDLNQPLPMPDHRYDLLINSGTAEHVFDQRQLFQSAHDLVRPGGLMVHMLPVWGWLDHGFVNYHPTLVADLAAANGYEALAWWWAEVETGRVAEVKGPGDFRDLARRFGTSVSAMMLVAWRKPPGGKPFAVPMQGYYAGTLDEQARRAWHEGR